MTPVPSSQDLYFNAAHPSSASCQDVTTHLSSNVTTNSYPVAKSNTIPLNETIEQRKERQRRGFEARALKRKLDLFDEALLCVQAFEDALAHPSWTVEPSIIFPTRYGQELYIVGDCPQLGQWDVQRAVRLKWGPGSVWSTAIHLPGRISSIEYKYLLMSNNGGGDKSPQWEWGKNHKISMRDHAAPTTRNVTNHISQPNANQHGLFPPRIWIRERDYWGGGDHSSSGQGLDKYDHGGTHYV